jgi:hypothetical protein
MTEDFLQYIWKLRLFNTTDLKTVGGQSLVVYQSGIHNFNAGPDFLNARIKIGEETWSGHVEIHIRSSDWKRHGHTDNEQYRNVILHVVYEHDAEIFLHQPGDLPVFVLKDHFPQEQWQRYVHWLESKTWIPCERQLPQVSQLSWSAWKDRLTIERLEQKSKLVMQILSATSHDWQETCYRLVARNFGFKVNTEGMEMLADSTPQILLAKHRSDPFQVEALLFGQAGFLERELEDEYAKGLKEEYGFLRQKYSLNPINFSVWKMARLRPSNFPAIRIAQLADLICKSEHLFSKLLETDEIEDLKELFFVEAHSYWQTHYRFDVTGTERLSLKMGSQSVENILINSVVPLLFTYGQYHDEEKYIDRALKILDFCSAEDNHVITNWSKVGVKCANAAESQSLLWLHNEYCNKKRCLSCNIGLELLKKNGNE